MWVFFISSVFFLVLLWVFFCVKCFIFCKIMLFKWVKLPSGCVVPGSYVLNVTFWVLFCKLLLLMWTYSEYGPPRKEHHARLVQGLWNVETIFEVLSKMAKCALALCHSNADMERSLSSNKRWWQRVIHNWNLKLWEVLEQSNVQLMSMVE